MDGTGPKTWTYNGGLMTDPLGNDTLYGFTPATPTTYCGPYLATKVQYYNGSHLNAANLVKTDETQYASVARIRFPTSITRIKVFLTVCFDC